MFRGGIGISAAKQAASVQHSRLRAARLGTFRNIKTSCAHRHISVNSGISSRGALPLWRSSSSRSFINNAHKNIVRGAAT